METINASPHLIKDTITLHLNTQPDCCIPLNGTKKSKSQYDLKSYIDFENDESVEYVTMSMPYAVICNSNYIIYDANDRINVIIGGYFNYYYVVPHGNYNAITFLTWLNAEIAVHNIKGTFNSITNKYTFTYSGTIAGNWGFDVGTTCDYNMGFIRALYDDYPSVTTITSEYPVDFLPIDRYIIHCNNISNGLMLTSNSKISSCDIIASVPNNARLNSQIIYQNTTDTYLVRNISNNGIIITVTNDNNQEIDFNNISWYFVLQFNVYRKSIQRPLRFSNLLNEIQKVNYPKMPEGVVLEE